MKKSPKKSQFKKYIEYIKNAGRKTEITGQHYCYLSHFREDFEPIGDVIIMDMVTNQIVEIDDNMFLRLL